MFHQLQHDLRTPLNHIIGYSEMLLEEAADLPQPHFEAGLAQINFAGQRLLTSINDLFDPVKSAAYQSESGLFEREIYTPIHEIIGSAERMLKQTREAGLEGGVADFEKILAAARKLLRLISENFTGSSGPLSPPAEPPVGGFFRRDQAAAVVLPNAFSDAGSPGGSILVADDDEGNRAMLARRLTRLGFTVTVAEDGRRALAAMRAAPFDLLLLDIQMPELNGYEVLEHMKADPALRHLPVIVLSASDETSRIVQCINMGAEDYLPKPFDPTLLQARIGASIEKKRLRDRETSWLRQIEEEKQRSDDLLHIILPQDIAAELKATNAVKPRRLANVGVLFCDIVSFTDYCDRHAPEEIHRDLQTLVEAFEILAASHGLEKIKTIGDAFMGTAGLLSPVDNPALHCARCGLDMIAKARELPPHWQIRVGVHVGPAIAGVVGRMKYQFDVWGDTVNTAARLEHAAAPGTLCVTAETWRELAAHGEGVSLGVQEMKGKGRSELYQVAGLRMA